MHKTTDCEYKYGLTGTLDGYQCHRLVLEGLFGPVKQVTTTRQLIDNKQLSDIKVHGIVLTYPKEECIISKYHDEISYITEHSKRNNLIKNLSQDQKGNTLILFSLDQTWRRVVQNLIKEKTNEVHLVYGKQIQKPEKTLEDLQKEKQESLLSPVSVYSVLASTLGILHNIIFASPYKSRIRNLQSIGRGLSLHDSKVSAKLYDIADDFDNKNHTIKHFVERINLYSKEEFDYEIHKVQM